MSLYSEFVKWAETNHLYDDTDAYNWAMMAWIASGWQAQGKTEVSGETQPDKIDTEAARVAREG